MSTDCDCNPGELHDTECVHYHPQRKKPGAQAAPVADWLASIKQAPPPTAKAVRSAAPAAPTPANNTTPAVQPAPASTPPNAVPAPVQQPAPAPVSAPATLLPRPEGQWIPPEHAHLYEPIVDRVLGSLDPPSAPVQQPAPQTDKGAVWLKWQADCRARKEWIEGKRQRWLAACAQRDAAIEQWRAYAASAHNEYKEAQDCPTPPRPDAGQS